MNYQELDNIFRMELAQKLELIEHIISQAPPREQQSVYADNFREKIPSQPVVSHSAFSFAANPLSMLLVMFALLLCVPSRAQTKATQSLAIGRIIDSTKWGGKGIELLDGTRIMARIVNIGTAASDSASGHGAYGSDALGGTFNGINDESDFSAGSTGLTLPGYLGDKTPTNFTRINSTPRERIDRGDATDYANAAGFHIWTEGNKPIRIKQLLLIDADGASTADNREWFTVFAFNDTARVYPTFVISTLPAAKLDVANVDVSINWYNLAKDSIPGIDTIRKADIVRNVHIGTPASYSGDPDNVNTQALADFGDKLVTDYFVLWGIRETVPSGGTQSSGLSPLLFEFEFDFGDAPNAYGTNLSSGGPYHLLPSNGTSPKLRLGDTVTSDNDGMPGVLANGDLDDGVWSVDTIALDTAVLTTVVPSYTVKAAMRNATGKTAKAVAWIDWNNDGTFGSAEAVTDTSAALLISDTLVFTWTGVSLTRSATSDLSTYARIRVTTDPISPSDAKGVVFSDGEVEDYLIPFRQTAYDYDDAPDSYGTLTASSGPKHIAGAALTLGSGITADADGMPGAAANGDADDGVSTVDSVYLLTSGASGTASDYTLSTQFINTSGQPAHFAAWVDWNNNGTFEAGEAVLRTVAAASTAGTVNFTWASPLVTRADTSDRTTYARIRVTTAPIASSDFNSSTFPDGEVESYLIPIRDAAALPLDVLSFVARAENDKVMLSWTVANGHQQAFFDVLKSTDGKQFRALGRINAVPSITRYSFEDTNPEPGLNLYRLKLTDRAGKVRYASETVSVLMNGGHDLTTFPNPANDKIFLANIPEGQSVRAVLYNQQGIIELTKILDKDNNVLETKHLKGGIYYLNLFDETGKLPSKRILITQ